MHYFSPKEYRHFTRSESTTDEKITANLVCKAKCIQANDGLQANGYLQANGGLITNGGLQANGGLQVNGGLQAHGTRTAHTKTKLTSISESDFSFDHVYDYIDNDSNDDDDYI